MLDALLNPTFFTTAASFIQLYINAIADLILQAPYTHLITCTSTASTPYIKSLSPLYQQYHATNIDKMSSHVPRAQEILAAFAACKRNVMGCEVGLITPATDAEVNKILEDAAASESGLMSKVMSKLHQLYLFEDVDDSPRIMLSMFLRGKIGGWIRELKERLDAIVAEIVEEEEEEGEDKDGE